MTEKRFTYHEFTRGIKDHQTKYIYEGNQETTDLLNKLYEQNQHYYKLLHLTANKIQNLIEENETIKNSIKEAYTNERTTLGKNVLKQLLNNME